MEMKVFRQIYLVSFEMAVINKGPIVDIEDLQPGCLECMPSQNGCCGRTFC